MTPRLSLLRALSVPHDLRGPFGAAALALALTGIGGSALAAPTAGASAPDAAPTTYAAGDHYTVKPGQSLTDVAIAVTQSHDRATLARASKALFDANPNAFMSHDPSRMRLGAVLTVPALDASGALAASGASGASGAGAETGAATHPASGAQGASAATQAKAAASEPAQAAAAGGAGASTAQATTAPAAPATSAAVGGSATGPATGPATAPATASAAPETGAASGGASAGTGAAAAAAASAPEAGSAASGVHEWTGAVKAPTNQTATASGAQPASQPLHVSSLQQLLALKNRVLMELQKHGIGGAPGATGGTAPASGTQPATGSPATAVGSGHGAATAAVASNAGLSQTGLSVAAAVGAALVVLLAALRMRRRKREALAAAQTAQAAPASSEPPEGAAGVADTDTVHPATTESSTEPPTAAHGAAAFAAAQYAAQDEAAPTELTVAAEDKAFDDPTALDLTEPSKTVAPHDDSAPVAEPLPEVDHESLNGATTAASLAAAAELGADALPRQPLEPVERVEPVKEASADEIQADLHADTPAHEPAPDEPQPATEPHAELPPLLTKEPADPALPSEFPRDAADAFGSLDMPLPPRIESPPESEHADGLSTTHPVASPETTARQAFPLPPDEDDMPRVEDEIAGGTAGSAAVAGLGAAGLGAAGLGAAGLSATTQSATTPSAATPSATTPSAAGLGAAGFGALNLDFDLELPPSPAMPLPAFSQADLARIARNKLDLAAEYIELGDLNGARTLINEVLEANDPATRSEARTLLSTLAPLS